MRLFIYLKPKNLLFILGRDRQIFLEHIARLLSYISRAFRNTLNSRTFFSEGGFFLFDRNAYLIYIEINLNKDNNNRLYRSRDTRV